MAGEPAEQLSLSAWQATGWEELASIWSGLFPESSELEGKGFRTFRSRSLSAQDAGSVFERWILEAFRLSGVEVHPSYTIPMSAGSQIKEQIDGVIFAGWQSFLIESKFWPVRRVDFGPVALLHIRVEQRPANTLGLLFSASGFSAAAIESASMLRPLRVLLFNRKDLDWAVQARNMMKMVGLKWRMAVKHGRPHFEVSEAEALMGGFSDVPE